MQSGQVDGVTQQVAYHLIVVFRLMALPATEMPAAEQALCNATAHAALLRLLVCHLFNLWVYPNLVPAQAHLCRGIQVLVQHRMHCVYMTKRMVGNAVMCLLGLLVVMVHNIQEIYAKQYLQHRVHSLEL